MLSKLLPRTCIPFVPKGKYVRMNSAVVCSPDQSEKRQHGKSSEKFHNNLGKRLTGTQTEELVRRRGRPVCEMAGVLCRWQASKYLMKYLDLQGFLRPQPVWMKTGQVKGSTANHVLGNQPTVKDQKLQAEMTKGKLSPAGPAERVGTCRQMSCGLWARLPAFSCLCPLILVSFPITVFFFHISYHQFGTLINTSFFFIFSLLKSVKGLICLRFLSDKDSCVVRLLQIVFGPP